MQLTVLVAIDVVQHHLDKPMTGSPEATVHVNVSILGETLHDSLLSVAYAAPACNGRAPNHKRCRQEQKVVLGMFLGGDLARIDLCDLFCKVELTSSTSTNQNFTPLRNERGS